jgi:ketopantoate hydroxymethyltransferase
MNLQTLKAQHPKLVDQIKTEELVKIERERILQLGELINPNVAKTVRILAEAGLTPEQAKTLLGSVSTVSEQDKKAEILAALKQAHGEGVAGNVPEMAKSRNPLMTAIQRRNKEGSEGIGQENPLLRAVREKNLA